MLDKFLNLLWKNKTLYKAFIQIDYLIRYRRLFKQIELTNDRSVIFIESKYFCGNVGFYKEGWDQYEEC